MVKVRSSGKLILCDECPLGKDSLASRKKRLHDLLGDWQPEYCSCDKIMERNFDSGGWCEDATYTETNTPRAFKSKHKRYNKYFRNKEHRCKELEHVVTSQMGNMYDAHNYFRLIKEGKGGLIYTRMFTLSGIRKVCKRRTNEIVRHSDVGSYGNYRRHYGYWNALF